MIQDNIRILIVDDVRQVRQGLVTMLGLVSRNLVLKIDVTGEAQNGEEAIQQATALHPDVILMDLEMPVIDGFTAARIIKSKHPSIWLVALTIHGDSATRMKALEAGFDVFVEKGEPQEDLIEAIQNCKEISKTEGD